MNETGCLGMVYWDDSERCNGKRGGRGFKDGEHMYMKFRKMVMMTLYVRQQKGHRYKEQTSGLCGRRRGWDDLRE